MFYEESFLPVEMENLYDSVSMALPFFFTLHSQIISGIFVFPSITGAPGK